MTGPLLAVGFTLVSMPWKHQLHQLERVPCDTRIPFASSDGVQEDQGDRLARLCSSLGLTCTCPCTHPRLSSRHVPVFSFRLIQCGGGHQHPHSQPAGHHRVHLEGRPFDVDPGHGARDCRVPLLTSFCEVELSPSDAVSAWNVKWQNGSPRQADRSSCTGRAVC